MPFLRMTLLVVYIPCMSPRNHADCVGNYCDAILSGEIIAGRTLLARELDGVHDRCGCADRDQRSRRQHPALTPKARCPIGMVDLFLVIRDWELRFDAEVRADAEVQTRAGCE